MNGCQGLGAKGWGGSDSVSFCDDENILELERVRHLNDVVDVFIASECTLKCCILSQLLKKCSEEGDQWFPQTGLFI